MLTWLDLGHRSDLARYDLPQYIIAAAEQANELEAERRSKVAIHSYGGTPGTRRLYKHTEARNEEVSTTN